MKITEPGHAYLLDCYDGEAYQSLVFVNREPGGEHAGTTTQEVLRALIDRTRYCDDCANWIGNDAIVYHLRMALALHEARALMRHAQRSLAVEYIAVDKHDGHFALTNVPVDEQAAPLMRPTNRNKLLVEPLRAEWQRE